LLANGAGKWLKREVLAFSLNAKAHEHAAGSKVKPDLCVCDDAASELDLPQCANLNQGALSLETYWSNRCFSLSEQEQTKQVRHPIWF
jgi:hypothetical protein